MGTATGTMGSSVSGRNVDRLFEFCVLGMVTCGYFAVAGSGYLDIATIVLTALALVARALMSSGALGLRLSPLVVNVATLVYIGFYPLDYLFVSKEFLPATVHLVFFLAITKVLTASTSRDFGYLKAVAFLELMAACLLNGRLNFFAFLAAFLLFTVGTFTASEIRRSATGEVRVVRAGFRGLPLRLIVLGVLLSVGVLAITGGLFFFLPRTARAAFQHLIPERYHLPGFSNEVTLGQIGEIKSQATAVMHVRFITSTWPANLKWRGVALQQFDGKRWYNDASTMYQPVRVERSGMVRLLEDSQRPSINTRRIAYEVHEKDFGSDSLFFAGVPEFLSINVPAVRRSPTGSVRAPLTMNGGVTYVAHAYVPGDGPPEVRPAPLSEAERREYLELPQMDPRIRELAQQVTRPGRNAEERARELELHLRTQYGYTLQLLDREVADPLGYFLFERKKGHCEYFASSMAVMLRTLEIPSRVVTGFQSGVFNPISGLQVIRTSDAHSWVEAYLPGRGWTTFDPTPSDPAAARESVWSRLAMYFDAAETFWQDWVLNYDLDHQLLLATRMQDSTSRGATWTDTAMVRLREWRLAATEWLKRYGPPLAAAFLIAAVVIFYGPSLLRLWRTRQRIKRVQRGQVDASDATLLYERMLRALERKGHERPAWVTPREFSRTLQAPEVAGLVEELTEAYEELRFGGKREAAPRMLVLLEQIERL